MQSRTIMEAIEFEAQALLAKEDETELLRRRAEIAWVAVDAGPEAKRWLAHLWAVSAQAVKRMAQVWEYIPHSAIIPSVPLSLYNAVLDIARDESGSVNRDEALAWLQTALVEEWSSRQLKNAAGLAKGRHYSDCQFASDRVRVTEWDPVTGGFAVVGFPVSGDNPGWARVTVQEVLQE